MTVSIGHAKVVLPGLPKPAPGEHMDFLLSSLSIRRQFKTETDPGLPQFNIDFDARNLLSSIAQWLTLDWAEHPNRGENFQASLTILECLERLQ